jgi:hypothetical protein
MLAGESQSRKQCSTPSHPILPALLICQTGFRNLLYLFPRFWANDSTVQFFKPFPALIELRTFGFASPDGLIRSTQNFFRNLSGHFVHMDSARSLSEKSEGPQPAPEPNCRILFHLVRS